MLPQRINQPDQQDKGSCQNQDPHEELA
jgi:hypothetical protein